MRKNFGSKCNLYPMPVLIIGTYDENGIPNAMNAAWGGICGYHELIISLGEHKTTDNIRLNKAFTVSVADSSHVIEADYVGIVSANQVPDKLTRAGLHAIKSEFVNAPLIEEFPIALECELLRFTEDGVIGKIINVSVDERVIEINGKVNPGKVQAITFDPFNNTYIELGRTVGKAFSDGKKIK